MTSLTDESGREGIEVERQDVETGHAVADRNAESWQASEQAVSDTNRIYREIFNATSDALFLQDDAGQILDVNDRTCTLFRCDRKSMIGQPIQKFSSGDGPDSAREIAEMIRLAVNDGPQVFESLSRRYDGELFWSEVALCAVQIAGQSRLIASVRDVSDRKRAEAALREREERFRELSLIATEGLMIHENGVILDANQAFAGLIGVDGPNELIGKQGLDVIGLTPDSKRRIVEKLQSGNTDVVDIDIERKDGTVIPAETWGRSTTYRGRPVRLVYMRDITERQRAESSLQASEERFRRLFNGAADSIILHDMTGRVVDVNEQSCDLLGYSRDELLALSIFEIEIGVSPTELNELWAQIQAGQALTFEGVHQRRDGSSFPVEVRVTLFDKGERPLVFASVRDISDRRRAEHALKSNERRLALAISATADAIWERNLQTDETYYSPRWFEMLGYQDRQFPMNHHSWKVLCHPDDLRPTLDCIQATLSGTQSSGYEAEYRMRAADGSWQWILGRGNVVERDSEGRPLILSGTNTNVTERKRAEEALAENEHRFRLMIQNFNDVLLILEAEGTERFVSPACERILGFPSRDLVGKNICSFIHPDDAARVQAIMSSLPSSKGRTIVIEFRHIHRDGSYLWMEASGTNLVDDPSIGGFVLVVRDITRRRQSEVETAEWKHRYDLLALAAGNVVYDCQSSGVVIWGGGFEQMFGFKQEQMQGGFEQWLERIHPDHRDFVQKRFAEAEAKGSLFKAEYRHLSRDGTYVLIEDTGYPYFDDSGKVERFIGVLVDITARKKADEENAKLAESLRHAQKMESIGRLAGGVAHDFNNLLTVISGNVSLAIMELQPNEPLYESMSEVIKAVDSAANLTRQLLAFSRKQVIDPKVLNLNAVVEHLQKLLRRLLGEDIELRATLAESLGQVRIDPGQVEQIIVNLAVNARDAMPDGGKLTLETANITLDAAYCRKYGNIQPGEYVMLAVADSGSGISDDVRAHLFEPFFTTKEQGKGTGLGLAMVYGAVTQHKGTIDVYSEVGHGTTFKILLPRVDEKPDQLRVVPSIQLARGTETVLLVEDDDMVRDLAVRLLKRQGYKVYAFPNGGEALMAISEISEYVHLLITDVVMPGVNGRVLAQNLRALRPTLKVLYTSGYTGDVIVHHGVLDKGIEFLSKPYSLEQLAKRVREVLDKQEPQTP